MESVASATKYAEHSMLSLLILIAMAVVACGGETQNKPASWPGTYHERPDATGKVKLGFTVVLYDDGTFLWTETTRPLARYRGSYSTHGDAITLRITEGGIPGPPAKGSKVGDSIVFRGAFKGLILDPGPSESSRAP
jgi:hypothetical protein